MAQAQFTRAFLREVLNAEDAEDKIIERHVEVSDGFRGTITKLNEELESLRGIKKDYDALKEKNEKLETSLKAQEEYIANVEKEKAQRAKEQAYREILGDADLTEEGINKAVKYANWDEIELEEDGKIKDPKKHIKAAQDEWHEHLKKTSSRGAETPTPPINNGGRTITKEQIEAIKDTSLRQRMMAENIDLYIHNK